MGVVKWTNFDKLGLLSIVDWCGYSAATERTGKFCFNAMWRAHVVVFDCFIAGTFFGFICVKLQGHLDPRNVCTRSDVVVTTSIHATRVARQQVNCSVLANVQMHSHSGHSHCSCAARSLQEIIHVRLTKYRPITMEDVMFPDDHEFVQRSMAFWDDQIYRPPKDRCCSDLFRALPTLLSLRNLAKAGMIWLAPCKV